MTEKHACKECGTLVLPSTLERTNGRCMPCFKKEHPFWQLEALGIKPIPVPTGEEAVKIRNKHLAELNGELRKILEREIAAGNGVVETYAGWPKQESIFVMLAKPFLVEHQKLPQGVVFRELNDPHYWKAEFVFEPSEHILACRFGSLP